MKSVERYEGQLVLKLKDHPFELYSFECYRCRFTNKKWHYYLCLYDAGPDVFDYISKNLDDFGNEDAKTALSFLNNHDCNYFNIFIEKFSVEPEDITRVKKDLGTIEHTIENNTLKIGNFELQRVKLTMDFYNIPYLVLHGMFSWRNSDVDSLLLEAPFDFIDNGPEILPLSYGPSSCELTT